MRLNRVKSDGGGIYHLISRVVDKDFKLTAEEKDIFVAMMRKAERFSDIDVLTYAVMSNHFHILVRVQPKEKPEDVSDEELLDRYRALYGDTIADYLAARWNKLGTDPNGLKTKEEDRAKLLNRMRDVSEFMKTLKSRYTISYNKRHAREGTLWSERFKSVLFEKGSVAMLTVARYIDLNAVRAGIVEDSKDYRWCGYSEACRGTRRAAEGIWMVENFIGSPRPLSQKEALQVYGSRLHIDGQTLREWYSKDVMGKMKTDNAKMPEAVALRCRIRHFELGVVMGRREFIVEMCQKAKFHLKTVRILTNTKFSEFWIARRIRHVELVEAKSGLKDA